jgi:transposase InsO family protein
MRVPKDEGDRQVANVPLNLLDRQFAAERPNQKWIADFTYSAPRPERSGKRMSGMH